MKKNLTITLERLLEALTYDAQTGEFHWKQVSKYTPWFQSQVAGTVGKSGYRMIKIDNKLYTGHRLAWLYFYGVDAMQSIDHINGIKSDNRISNLRNVSHRENCINRQKHRNGRLYGASSNLVNNKTNPWAASIRIGTERKHLGSFKTEQEAHDAYQIALQKLHAEPESEGKDK